MKRILKVILVLLGVVAIFFIGMGIYIATKKPTVHENKAPEITVQADSAMLAEGTRIASLLCVNCHGNNGVLSGGPMEDTKKFGKLFAPNITRHPAAKIAGYTDGELMYLFRTGVKKDGTYAPPWMPKFPLMSDKDLHSIIAFLRSDHPMLAPTEIVQPSPQPNFLAKALLTFVFKPFPYPEEVIEAPDTSDRVKWGEYLALAKFDCFSCHSADFATCDYLTPSKSAGFFGGGNPLERKDGTPVASPNITMDPETGLGNWTEKDFIKTVRFGERPSGVATAYPMVPFSNMTDAEVSAIWAYLQTVPVIKNEKLKK